MVSTAATADGAFDEELGRRISRAVKDWTGRRSRLNRPILNLGNIQGLQIRSV